jgi:hypothetical protein
MKSGTERSAHERSAPIRPAHAGPGFRPRAGGSYAFLFHERLRTGICKSGVGRLVPERSRPAVLLDDRVGSEYSAEPHYSRIQGGHPGGRSCRHTGARSQERTSFTTEVWTPRGLLTYYTLFVLDLRRRRVHVAGSTLTPDGCFMAQTGSATDRCGRWVPRHGHDVSVRSPGPGPVDGVR